MLFYNATYPYRHQTSNYGGSLMLIDLPKEMISRNNRYSRMTVYGLPVSASS